MDPRYPYGYPPVEEVIAELDEATRDIDKLYSIIEKLESQLEITERAALKYQKEIVVLEKALDIICQKDEEYISMGKRLAKFCVEQGIEDDNVWFAE